MGEKTKPTSTTTIVQQTNDNNNVIEENKKKELLYGQRVDHQLDNTDDLRLFLKEQIDSNNKMPLFKIQNGYTIANRDQLEPIQQWYNSQLQQQQEKDGSKIENNSLLDKAKSLLKIGIHEDIEVTHCGGFGKKKIKNYDDGKRKMYVTHALCSACAINYNRMNSKQQDWEGLARLILDSAYESTLYAAVETRQRWNPNYDCTTTTTTTGTTNNLPYPGAKKVYLTLLGGGVFGNDINWILDAIENACMKFRLEDLDVSLVCYNDAEKNKLQQRVTKIQNKITMYPERC